MEQLVRSLGTDITLDNVLAILDEHYNNFKALDAFEPGAISTVNGQKKKTIGLGDMSVKASPSSCCIVPRMPSIRPHH